MDIEGDLRDVTREIVDELNAGHAAGAGDITPSEAATLLRRSGDELVQIAIRHPDDHRAAIEASFEARTLYP